MPDKDFDTWFEEVKENAKEDFGYTENEISNFSSKNWKEYYYKNISPFEAIMAHIKRTFKQQNK